MELSELSTGDAIRLPFDVPGDWTTSKLSACTERIQDGDWIESRDQGGNDYRLLQISNIGVGRFTETGNYRWITRETFERLNCTDVRLGDVLVARMPDPTGRAWYVSGLPWKAITAVDIAIIRVKEGRLDARFLSYFLNSPTCLAVVHGLTTGTTRLRIRRSDIERLTIPLPPLSEQRAIGNILSVLDDKIELNRKISATLEAIARALFRSWFVDFDPVRWKAGKQEIELTAEIELTPEIAALFPDSFQASEWGEIPTGWDLEKLGNVIQVFDSKRIPLSGRQRADRKGPYPYYGAASVMDHVDDFLFTGVHLLIGEDGSVVHDDGTPVLQYVWGNFWVNNHAHVVVGKGHFSTEQVYLLLQRTNMRPYVTGAVQPKLNQGNLFSVPLVCAPQQVCSVFSNIISPLFERIRLLSDECKSVGIVRDALLPKLTSGELRVPEAERILGNCA